MAEKFKVAQVSDVPEGGAIPVEVNGAPIALVRLQGKVYALDGRCPHRGGPLGEGFVSGGKVTCPWHGWSFDVATGNSSMIPNLKQQCYEVSVEGDDVYIAM